MFWWRNLEPESSICYIWRSLSWAGESWPVMSLICSPGGSIWLVGGDATNKRIETKYGAWMSMIWLLWWEGAGSWEAFKPACNPLIGLICCHRGPPFMFQHIFISTYFIRPHIPLSSVEDTSCLKLSAKAVAFKCQQCQSLFWLESLMRDKGL